MSSSSIVVVIVVVVVTVVEVVVLQVFFGRLPRDLLLQLLVGFGVVAVVLADRFIVIIDVCRLVGVVVMATVGRGHSLEHRMLAVRMRRHLGDRRLLGLALLGPPARRSPLDSDLRLVADVRSRRDRRAA